MIAENLVQRGGWRSGFVAYANSASTVAARIAGYREALFVSGVPVEPALVQSLDTGEEDEVRHLMEMLKPDGIIGANDRTAGDLIHRLSHLDYSMPLGIRHAGRADG